MYVWSIHWVFQSIFCILQAFMFFDRQKGGQTEKKKAHFREPMFRNWPPEPPTGAHCDRKGAHSGFGMGPEDQSYQATLQFALKRPDFCEVHDLRDSKALLRRRGFRACTQSMRSAGSVSESQDCESIFSTVPTTSQTVKQKSFSTRRKHQKGKAKKLTRETVTCYWSPTTCKKQ